jgi:hypothetical protein
MTQVNGRSDHLPSSRTDPTKPLPQDSAESPGSPPGQPRPARPAEEAAKAGSAPPLVLSQGSPGGSVELDAPGSSPGGTVDPVAPPLIPSPPPVAIDSIQPNTLLGAISCKPVQRLKEGGFGEVWQIEQPGGIPAAAKIIFKPLEDREAPGELTALELVKMLRHPFLLQTQSSHIVEDRLIIVMELADGSLRDRLEECHNAGLKGIPPEELVQYVLEAGEALDYLHEKEVHHRDVKPENILMIGGHAKLADFGLARHQAGSCESASAAGTQRYMAPEVWRGQLSRHSDQYSLALSYGELRLGHRLIQANCLYGMMQEHLNGMPDLDPLPPAEQQVLSKALAKEPSQRYPSCVGFAQALGLAVKANEERPVSAVRAHAADRLRRWLLNGLQVLLG